MTELRRVKREHSAFFSCPNYSYWERSFASPPFYLDKKLDVLLSSTELIKAVTKSVRSTELSSPLNEVCSTEYHPFPKINRKCWICWSLFIQRLRNWKLNHIRIQVVTLSMYIHICLGYEELDQQTSSKNVILTDVPCDHFNSLRIASES